MVPLNVNAVLFWMVYDAEAACTEVGDFTRAVELSAQTALRDAIGRGTAAEVAIRRQQLDRELKAALEEKCSQWGIAVLSVEIRDILLPKELQDTMSLEAQAEQRKKSRIILAEAEQDICDMMTDMGQAYAGNDAALRLRAMHLLYESVRETGGHRGGAFELQRRVRGCAGRFGERSIAREGCGAVVCRGRRRSMQRATRRGAGIPLPSPSDSRSGWPTGRPGRPGCVIAVETLVYNILKIE